MTIVLVYGDKGYVSGVRKRAAEAAGVLWAVKEKGTSGRSADGAAARPQSPVRQSSREGRACVPGDEMPVLAIARFAIAASPKNARSCVASLALANLYIARKSIASA